MTTSRLLLAAVVALALACTVSARITWTGDAFADFGNAAGVSAYADEGNMPGVDPAVAQDAATEPHDVGMPDGFTDADVSGWDMRAVYIAYDKQLDLLQLAIDCYGVCGDADGNGDAGTTSEVLRDLGGRDRLNLESSETFSVLIDPLERSQYDRNDTDDFYPTLVVGWASNFQATTQDFGVFEFDPEERSYPSQGYGDRLDSVAGAGFSADAIRPGTGNSNIDNAAVVSIEVNIFRFSALPGFSSFNDPEVDGFAFKFHVFAGSLEDAGIGEDYVPSVGAGLLFEVPPCAADDCGVCDGPGMDSCELCYGDEMFQIAEDECGVCFGAGRDECGLCPADEGYGDGRDECGICYGQIGYQVSVDSCGNCFGDGADECGYCPGDDAYLMNRDDCGLCPEDELYGVARDCCGVCFGDGFDDCGLCSFDEGFERSRDECGICFGAGRDECFLCPGDYGHLFGRDECGLCPYDEGYSSALDECGICGGPGRDECGYCFNDEMYGIGKDECGLCPEDELYGEAFDEGCEECFSEGLDVCKRCPGDKRYKEGFNACGTCDKIKADECGYWPCEEAYGSGDCHGCDGVAHSGAEYNVCGMCGVPSNHCPCWFDMYKGYEQWELDKILVFYNSVHTLWHLDELESMLNDTLSAIDEYAVEGDAAPAPFCDWLMVIQEFDWGCLEPFSLDWDYLTKLL